MGRAMMLTAGPVSFMPPSAGEYLQGHTRERRVSAQFHRRSPKDVITLAVCLVTSVMQCNDVHCEEQTKCKEEFEKWPLTS